MLFDVDAGRLRIIAETASEGFTLGELRSDLKDFDIRVDSGRKGSDSAELQVVLTERHGPWTVGSAQEMLNQMVRDIEESGLVVVADMKGVGKFALRVSEAPKAG